MNRKIRSLLASIKQKVYYHKCIKVQCYPVKHIHVLEEQIPSEEYQMLLKPIYGQELKSN